MAIECEWRAGRNDETRSNYFGDVAVAQGITVASRFPDKILHEEKAFPDPTFRKWGVS
jgi:hypothetical protein